MKFSLISDMHLDHPQLKTPYNLLEKNVVVAGDTANGLLGLKFLQKLRNKGFNVFAVDGNHEHYSNSSQGRKHSETLKRFQSEHPIWQKMDDVPVVLVNGWYSVSSESLWRNTMNDSRFCCIDFKDVNMQAINDAKTVEYQLQQWQETGIKGVVVTHTAPCQETLDPQYEGEFSNEWYWNPHMKLLLEKYSDSISVWCHGHTHAFQDKIVDGVRVVCNPRGYPGENPNWKPYTVEIE